MSTTIATVPPESKGQLVPRAWGENAVIPVSDRIPLLGRVKVGKLGSFESWGRMPVKLDHFIITTNQRTPEDKRDPESGNFILDKPLMDELLSKGFGDPDKKLRRIPIRLLSSDINSIFRRRWIWSISGKKKAGECLDGKTFICYADPRPGNHPWLPKPITKRFVDPDLIAEGKADADEQDADIARLGDVEKVIKKQTTFAFGIRAGESRIGGAYGLSTTSSINWTQLPGSIKQIAETIFGKMEFPPLTFLPLDLVVEPASVSPPNKDGVPTPSTVYVVRVEINVKKAAIAVLGQDIGGSGQDKYEQYKRALRSYTLDEWETEAKDLVRMRQHAKQVKLLMSSAELLDGDLESAEDAEFRPVTEHVNESTGEITTTPPSPPAPAEHTPDAGIKAPAEAGDQPLINGSGKQGSDPTVAPTAVAEKTTPTTAGVATATNSSDSSASEPAKTEKSAVVDDPVHNKEAFDRLLNQKGWLYENVIKNVNIMTHRKGMAAYGSGVPWLDIDEQSRVTLVKQLGTARDAKRAGK